jgi:hypothetical protein
VAHTNGLARRLDAIEAALHPERGDPAQAERERQWAERDRVYREKRAQLALELSKTMAPEHIALVNAVLGWGADGEPCEFLTDPGAVHLADMVEQLLTSAGTDWWPRVNQRLALPTAVAEALLKHGGAAWMDGTCLACRLPLPWRLHGKGEGTGMASGPRVFECCPDCGSSDIVYGYRRRTG